MLSRPPAIGRLGERGDAGVDDLRASGASSSEQVDDAKMVR
jgi:hypothetical protein